MRLALAVEGEGTQLDIDRANLKRRLQEDHQSRSAVLDEVILIIAEAISDLYEDRLGRFVVDATDNGPEFKISIEGDRGGGIANMEIFCVDLALLKVVTKRFGGPEFLGWICARGIEQPALTLTSERSGLGPRATPQASR